MNDELHNSLPAVESELAAAAVGVDVGDPNVMLTTVRKTVVKRRRRRNAVLGVAAAGTLVMSGVVIANLAGTDGDDVFSTATDPVVDSTSTTAVASDTLEPVTPPPVEVVATSSAVVTDPGFAADAGPGDTQLLEWHDGFLALSAAYDPQPLPTELPQEVIDLFPQEVVDLFADGLPATIDEATAMLTDAGLLDEVSQIISSNPDASDAIYSAGSSRVVTTRVSPDGVEWSDIDLALPNGVNVWDVVSTGDRLVAVGTDFGPFSGAGTDGPTTFDVVSSTDLVNWTTQTVDAVQPPADLPDYVTFSSYPGRIAANDAGWVLAASSYQDVDLLSLVPPEVRAELENTGYGTTSDDESLTIEVYQEGSSYESAAVPATTVAVGDASAESDSVDVGAESDSGTDTARAASEEPLKSYTFTWAELGLDGPPEESAGESVSAIWTSNWVDAPIESTADANLTDYGQVIGFDGGFAAAASNGATVSTDGVTWTSTEFPGAGFTNGLLPVGDSVIAFATANNGAHTQYRLDLSTLTWTAVEIPGLPAGLGIGSVGDGAATFYDYGTSGGVATAPSGETRSWVEADGYRFELTVGYAEDGTMSLAYELTLIETGEVVSSESVSGVDAEVDEPFEFAHEVANDGGIAVVDPATGETLVVFDFEQMVFEQIGPDGEVIEITSDVSIDVEADYSEPDMWIVATDGASWLVEQIPPNDSSEYGPGVGAVAMSNGVVLASRYDGTFLRYELG